MREKRKVGIFILLILVLITEYEVKATAPKVDSIIPTCGSINGGTRITIYGSGFARNFFNVGDGNEDLGSRVELVNINSFECEIHPDGSHETQIMCYTLPMPAGEYSVRVSVDGIPVPSDRYCNNPNKCIFKSSSACTPTITNLVPFSGMPGSFLEIFGDIKTIKYGSNEPDEFQDKILRVYFGGQKCELRDIVNDVLYGIYLEDHDGWMKCRTEGTYVGNVEISYLISNEYGRSKPAPDTLHVRRRNRPSMYQAFTEISHISQSHGSKAGGTRLVITGQHFDETDFPAKVFVGGQECEIVKPVTDTTIVCITPADASDGIADFTGGRGLYSFIHYNSTEQDSFSYEEANVNHTDSSSWEESSPSSYVQRLTGYFVPPYSGEYTFYVKTDSYGADFFLSNDSNSEYKTEINSGTSPQTLNADTPYYLEIRHASTNEDKHVHLRAYLAQTDLSEVDTGMAQHEIQSIRFTSTITKDIQEIEVIATGTASNSQQDVQIMNITGNPDAYFAIGLDGIFTVPLRLSTLSSGAEVQAELEKLPSIYFDISVDLQLTGSDALFSITSNSPQGKISDYEARVVGGTESDLMFSIERRVLGEPDLETFTLTLDGIPTYPIAVGASAMEVQSAVETLFEVSCHPKLYEGNIFGFEASESWMTGRVSDVEPFCGHYSVKNPRYIYHRGYGEDDIGLGVSSSRNTFMCFAYMGFGKVSSVRILFSYIDDQDESRTSTASIYVNNDNPTVWRYHCEDIFEVIRSRVSGRSFFLWHIRAYRMDGGQDLFIDHVLFDRRPPLDDALMDGIYNMRGPQVQPNGYFIDTVTVTALSASQYQIELSPHHCGHDLPTFEVAGASTNGSAHTISNGGEVVVSITRVQTASPPIGGFFNVTFKEVSSPSPIPVTVEIDTDNIVANLATMSVGFSEVTGFGSCSAFTYKVKMVSTTGDQPLMEIDSSLLTGTNVQVTVSTNQDGGVWLDPIMGDLLRTHHTSPQVIVFINDVPTRCSSPTACTFEWSTDFTPTVSDISPSSGSHGDLVSISGTGFDGSDPDSTQVIIGVMPCNVVSVNDTTITCTINNGPTGAADVKVYVPGKGLAETTVTFTYVTGVDPFSSTSGSVAGGTLLTISGYGFTSDAVVTLDGNECMIQDISESEITCKTPQAESESVAANVTVVITQPGSVNEVGQFTYDPEMTYTPIITGISSTTSNVWGGDPIIIDGEGFGNVEMPVTLGGVHLTVSSYNDTQIVAILPALSHGSYKLVIDVENKGYADLRTNNISDIIYTFQVDSMTPSFGSMYGGTDILIAGEGFSTNRSLFDVKVGNHKCDIESLTSTQIKCRIADTGTHHFITANGTHKFYGVGYAWDKDPFTVKVGDYVTWSWETPFYVTDITYGVHQTASASDIFNMEGGFSSGSNNRKGSFTHRFTIAGTYTYWTGFLDSDNVLYFRGTITVTPLISSVGILSLKMNGYEASYNTAGSQVIDTSGCVPLVNFPVFGCADTTVLTHDATKFNFDFLKCNSPFVNGISRTNGTTDDTITLSGLGFAGTNCQNRVTFDGATCETVSSSPVSIGFRILVEDSPPINAPHEFELHVANYGYALTTIADARALNFVLLPSIESVTPSEGSKMGGTKVTLSGSGFVGGVDNIFVDWQYLGCDTEAVNYTQIICETRCGSTPDNCFLGSMPGHVTVGNVLAECLDSVCNFTTIEELTATITGLSPDTVSDASTEITVIGDGFGTVAADLVVKIGGQDCIVIGTPTDTNFTCEVGRLPVGYNRVDVFVGNNGKAATTLTILSENEASITSPYESSMYGGAILTVTGNGFVRGDTVVSVGGKDCPVIMTTFEEVTCTLPAHAEGNESVIITSNYVQYDSLMLSYSLAVTPDVIDITPPEGKSGDEVTITGTGFKPSSTNPIVRIGGVVCSVTTTNDTHITCTVGTKQTGTYNVQVLAPGSGYSNFDIMFTYKLGAFSVNPSTGSTNGGQAVTLDGSGFLEHETVVTICGEQCEEISVSASEYICSTPKHSNVSASIVCDVVVTVEGVTETNAAAYTYDPSLLSSITSVNPSRAGTGGSTLITITGTNFGSEIDDIRVTIANVSCTVQTVHDTEITCLTGRARSGDVFVSVQRNEWGEAMQINAAFQYIDLWSSPFTWGGGSPPSHGEFVFIPVGQKILLDNDTGVLSMLLIQGELIFDEKDIELQAENILITDGGSLSVGSDEKPFPRANKAIITLHGHLRSRELPIYGTKTVAVREGTLNLYGAHITHTWSLLNRTATAGSSNLELMHSVDWQIGDEIVIATTGPRHSQKESEVHVIKNISADGYTLTLESPLAYEHIGISGTFGNKMVDFRAEVGLLTRNIVVRGYRNTEFDTHIEACPDGFNTGEFATQTCFQGRFGEELGSDQFGAQIMVHQAEKNTQVAQAHLQYVEFTHSGQAFRLGRYPIHFHLNGDMSQSFVIGCAIHISFNRAVNVHGSHNVLVERNVIYNIMGGAFFLEDGDETGNIFQYNLAIFVRASTSLRNDDITPAAFWATNPNNIIRHNHVAGGTHFASWYRMHRNPDGPGFDSNICPQATPLGEYRNNSAHSQGWFGLWIFEVYVPREGASCFPSSPHKVAKFYSLTAWNCEKGAEGVNTGAVQFREFVLVNNEKAGYEGKLIVNSPPQFDPENGPGIYDSDIVAHYGDILRGRATRAGITLPYYSGFMVGNNRFYNFDESGSAAFRWTRIDGTCGIYCGGFRTDTVNLQFINSPNRVAFDWESEGVLYDRDGTLTGSAGYSVAACTPSFDSSQCGEDPLMSVGIPGCVCSDQIKLIRFSFNNIVPDSLNFKDAIFTSEFGSTVTPWAKKRISHPKGWSVVLMANHYYNFTFDNADHITNVSLVGALFNFDISDFIVFTQFTEQRPDRFMLDGVTNLPMSNSPLTGTNVGHGDWYYQLPNSLTYALSRLTRRKREVFQSSRDFSIDLKVIRCFYLGCEPPKPPSEVTMEPAYKQKWSDASTWLNFTDDGHEPGPMDDLTIPKDKWIIVDKAIHPLGKLVIEGGLQFESGSTQDIVLEADYIHITGRLIVGWSNEDPYLGKVIIRLRGSHSTPAYPVTDGPSLGSKFMAVFGGLQLHGVDRGIIKTFLANTVMPGSDSITVRDNVTWVPGDEILITTTDYDAWHTEVFMIVDIIDKTITLNDTIKYRHIAHSENVNGDIIDLSASVALLTRSIRIEGEEYPEMEEESFGARVIVGQTFDHNGQHSGFAQISNVEFYHTGQEGFTENYDARFSLTYSDVTSSSESVRYSYVTKSTFHSGYNTALGVFGTDGIEINDNIVFHTVGPAIRTESTGTRITHNLVALSIWPGAYQDRLETMNFDYDGAIHAVKSKKLFLTNNIIAGSERVGFRLPGQACGTAAGDLWTNNMAQACLAGVLIFNSDPVANGTCVVFHGFKLWKNFDFGIYYLNNPKVEMKNNILVENGVSLFPMVVGPKAVRHSYADKTVKIENNILIGKTSSFSESEDILRTSDDNIRLSAQGRSVGAFVPCGKIGVMMGTFSSEPNMAPEKPFVNIMSYPAIKGLTILKGNTFANFGSCTGGYDHAIATNNNNDDGIHPLQISETTLVNVDPLAQVFFHFPNVGKVNPSDCVDMDCDGLKKCMIRDLDGSFLGSKGTVLPNSAYEWDGDPRHGLGDYRIPAVMLTSSSGEKIDVNDYAPNKGIYKTDNCTWITEWNAFKCGDSYEWRMLIIESMDDDTETRRLSPVAIFHPEGYIDLINGPQDHGWCNGYTCQERLSTFQAIVALDEPFDIFLTSTNPKAMRYMLLNSAADECVRLGMWYFATYRLEVAVDGVTLLPINGFITGSGAFRLRLQETTNQYMPDVNDKINGEYYISQPEQMIFWVQCGGDSVITVTMKEVFIVAFTLPAMTETEFFGERIVENLAAFLRIDPKKVRIVNIVEDTSNSARRKRQTDAVTFYVEFADTPGESNTVDYDTIVPELINAVQLGNIDEVINATVLYTAILEPNSTTNGEIVTIQRVGQLVLDTHPVANGVENEVFEVQPKLKVTDENGDVVIYLGSVTTIWKIEASIKSGDSPTAMLLGDTMVNFTDGWANFTDLAITHKGSYILEFHVVSPPQATNFSLESLEVTVIGRNIGPKANLKTTDRLVGSPVELEVSLVDKDTNTDITDIEWANHIWTAQVAIFKPDIYPGSVDGTLSVTFDSSSGKGTFSDLLFSEPGICPVLVIITDDRDDYEVQMVVYITIWTSEQNNFVVAERHALELKLPIIFDLETAPIWTAKVRNYYGDYPDMRIVGDSYRNGSLIITLSIEATLSGYNDTLLDMCSDIENGTSFTVDNTSVALSGFLTVDGVTYYGVSCGKVPEEESSSDGMDTVYIIVIAVLSGIIFILICIFLSYKCYFHQNSQKADTQTAQNRGLYSRSDLLTDALSRDGTLMSLKSRPYTPPVPSISTSKSFDLSMSSPSPTFRGRGKVSPEPINGSSTPSSSSSKRSNALWNV